MIINAVKFVVKISPIYSKKVVKYVQFIAKNITHLCTIYS